MPSTDLSRYLFAPCCVERTCHPPAWFLESICTRCRSCSTKPTSAEASCMRSAPAALGEVYRAPATDALRLQLLRGRGAAQLWGAVHLQDALLQQLGLRRTPGRALACQVLVHPPAQVPDRGCCAVASLYG